MIFKSIEIYFLYAPSHVRWGITFTLVGLIVCAWYYAAFVPMRSRINTLTQSLEHALQEAQEGEQNDLSQSITHNKTFNRIAFVGKTHDFIKDLLAHKLTTKQITIEQLEKIDGFSATSIKIIFNGSFENFYEFLRTSCHKNYLCLWNSCICTPSPDGELLVDAHITLYF